MNRLEFFSKLQEFENSHKNTLKHSNGRDFGYYAKIDKYYPDGTSRYFYTKDQWDAYQKGLELSKKAKQHNDELAEKEKLEKQQKETFEKNKAADNAKKLEERKKNDPNWQKQQDDTLKKNEEAAKAQDIEQRNRDFAKKKENNPQMLNANGDWRNDRGESDMAWALFTEAGGLDGDLPYYLATLVRGEREPSDSRKERCERIIDVRYNKKEAEECRKLINDIVQDAEDIKDQVLADEKLKKFLDEFQKSVDEGSWNYYKAHDEMVQLVHKLFNYYSKQSKYADYYWQDSSTWKSGGLVMGNMNQRSWNAVDEIMKNMIKKYKEKNKK